MTCTWPLTFVFFSELWPQCWGCEGPERDVYGTEGQEGGLRGGSQQEVRGTQTAVYTRRGECHVKGQSVTL